MLEGAIEVRIDDDVFALQEGHALTFGAAAPHIWRNRSQKRAARTLWILAPSDPRPRRASGPPYSFLMRLQRMGIDVIHADSREAWELDPLAQGKRRLLMAEDSPRSAQRLRAMTAPRDAARKRARWHHVSADDQ